MLIVMYLMCDSSDQILPTVSSDWMKLQSGKDRADTSIPSASGRCARLGGEGEGGDGGGGEGEGGDGGGGEGRGCTSTICSIRSAFG